MLQLHQQVTRPKDYKTFFMLNSTEHEISSALGNYIFRKTKIFLTLKLLDVVFILLINVKMPTIVGILTFMSRINFMLKSFEHEHFL